MSVFIVDVESDGPCPALYSMISIGVVRLDRELKTTFKATFAPISDQWVPEALAVSGITREQHLEYPDPEIGMKALAKFLKENSEGRPVFASDNPAYDFQWPSYYFTRFMDGPIKDRNPFGFSGRRIGDLYSGLVGDWFASSKWKSLRKTKHTHDPVDDARGNAEALTAIADQFKLKIKGL